MAGAMALKSIVTAQSGIETLQHTIDQKIKPRIQRI